MSLLSFSTPAQGLSNRTNNSKQLKTFKRQSKENFKHKEQFRKQQLYGKRSNQNFYKFILDLLKLLTLGNLKQKLKIREHKKSTKVSLARFCIAAKFQVRKRNFVYNLHKLNIMAVTSKHLKHERMKLTALTLNF